MHLALGLDGYNVKGRRFVRQMPQPGVRRAAYDMVVAPAKSISLAALMGPAETRVLVRKAFNESSELALSLVEDLAARQGKATRRTHSGTLCAAIYSHERSRYADPHLHRHFLMLNVTRLRDGTLWALTVEFGMKVLGYIERIFQADLYRRLLKAGLPATLKMQVADLALPKDLCARFSRGHAGIVETIARIEGAGEKISLKRRRALGNIVNDRQRPRGHRKSNEAQWDERLNATERQALDALKVGPIKIRADLPLKEVAARVGASLGTAKSSGFLEDRWAAVTRVVEADPAVEPQAAIAAAARFMAPLRGIVIKKAKTEAAADHWRLEAEGRARQALARLARNGHRGATA